MGFAHLIIGSPSSSCSSVFAAEVYPFVIAQEDGHPKFDPKPLKNYHFKKKKSRDNLLLSSVKIIIIIIFFF
jgi:hypothetical protein